MILRVNILPSKNQLIINYRNYKFHFNRRRHVLTIFQMFNLVESKTVYENIAFSLKAAGKTKDEIYTRVNELLQVVGLMDKAKSYPSKLSGGQKQRVGIARALANNAQILLCDEPTSALDIEATAAILKLLRDINEKYGITIIIITHELEVIKAICNKVAVMNKGKVVEEGLVYDLFTKPKHEFTKQLLEHSSKFELPKELIKSLKGTIVKIKYIGESATDPVLSKLSTKYNVTFNILHGKIEYIRDLPVGILYLNITGSDESIIEAINYLKISTFSVEVINYGIK
ncbi:MAG TPA: NIL domain-containing protein [Clostridium sp.]|uniref:methionine ABC transporter ATP-binding protein n=1 Tax=Clostridium sp. TaxID=1506 RepID=UPI002F935257